MVRVTSHLDCLCSKYTKLLILDGGKKKKVGNNCLKLKLIVIKLPFLIFSSLLPDPLSSFKTSQSLFNLYGFCEFSWKICRLKIQSSDFLNVALYRLKQRQQGQLICWILTMFNKWIEENLSVTYNVINFNTDLRFKCCLLGK